MNLTKQYTNATNKTTYFKSLSAKAQDNPNNSTNNSISNPANDTKYSEVQATQAGGILAYAPNNAEYEYILNQDTWMSVITGDANQTSYTNVPKGTRVVVLNESDTSAHKVSLSADGQSIATFKVVDSANTVYVPAQASAATFVPVNIDSETFKPLTPGLYLFARNVNMTEQTNAAITADYEFGGYYYSDFDTVPTYTTSNVSFAHTQKDDKDTVSGSTAKGEFGQGTYYALKYNEDGNSDYSVLGTTYTSGTAPTTTQVSAKVDPATGELLLVQPTANLELFTATQTVSENTDFNWKYIGQTEQYKVYTNDAPAGGTLKKKYYVFDSKVYNSVEDIKKDKVSTDTTDGSTTVTSAYLTSSYTEGTENAVNGSADMIYASKDDIIVDIELANIDTSAEKWTVLKDETGSPKNKYTFYYNNDVEEGDTTARLVESVKLDESITKDDYMAFDFDLNVKMESVQVTYDADGKESVLPADAEFKAGDAPVKITSVTGTNTGDEITSIAWSNA